MGNVARVAVVLALVTLALGGDFEVGADHFIKDSQNNTRLFHGVNAVYKIPPWHPETGGFDPFNSLSDKDFEYLNSFGLNVVRLGVMWPGVQPVSITANQTYLDILAGLVDRMGMYNITVILDMHQDLLSPYFCGEGVPDYVTQMLFANVSYNFPAPLPFKLDKDPKTGYPLLSECLGKVKNFAEYYVTSDAAQLSQQLYTNERLQTPYIQFWRDVARTFKDKGNVLGYELINEPFLGNIFGHPKDLLPHYTDLHLLQPLYAKVFDAITAIDNKTIVFYEGVVLDEVLGVGFTEGPGGPGNTSRQVLSYHVYCPAVNKSGAPISGLACAASDQLGVSTFVGDAVRLGGGGFMTEFGALDNTEASAEELDRVCNLADSHIQSWTYWTYKSYHDITTANTDGSEGFFFPNGTLQARKVKSLARGYARKIAGTPSVMKFDTKTGALTVTFEVAHSGQTEIYFPSPHFTLTVSDPRAAYSASAPYIYVECPPEVGTLTVQISPA